VYDISLLLFMSGIYKVVYTVNSAYKDPAYKDPAYKEPAYKDPAYKDPILKEPAYKELLVIRNWFSFPNLQQKTI